MFNKIILIGRLGQNAEKTAQNNREYVVLNIATQDSWKNDKSEYETRTEWHRAGRRLPSVRIRVMLAVALHLNRIFRTFGAGSRCL